MQIHDLNNYNGDLNGSVYLAVDDGNDTGKVSAQTLLGGVRSEITELDTELTERIDNIIAGGDAPSAAEIIDARRGGNGINYSSLGEAVRGQYSTLEADTVNSNSGLFIPPNKWSDSDRYNNQGQIITDNTCWRTDFLAVSETKKIKIKKNSLILQLVYFRGDKSFARLSSVQLNSGDEYVVVPGFAFVVVQVVKSSGDYNDVEFVMSSNEMINNEYILDYMNNNPYNPSISMYPGFYISRTGEVVVSGNQQLAISEYIKIPAGTYKIVGYKYSANISSLAYAMNFYDLNRNWLGGIDYKETGTVLSEDLPAGTEYIILLSYDTESTPTHEDCKADIYALGVNHKIEELGVNNLGLDNSVLVEDIFTDKTAIKNTVIDYTNGNAAANNLFLATDFIEVEPETDYHVMRDNNLVSSTGNMAFYNESKTYISGRQSTWTDWTTPANAKYVRISVYMSPWTQDTFTFDNVKIIKGSSAKAINDVVLLDKANHSVLKGKKWIGIGDSLTEVNARADLRYWNYIADSNGMSFVNMGVGGTGYINRQNESKAFYQRAESMESDADIITVFGGVNDCLFSTAPIGEPTDAVTTTWCGCVNKLIDNIRDVYLYAPLGIISPLPCDWTDPNNESQYDTQMPDDVTCRMSEFVSKLKTICELRGVPFLDLYHQSNLLPNKAAFKAEYYSCGDSRTGDGLHPNSKGHKLFYKKVEQFIESLIQ